MNENEYRDYVKDKQRSYKLACDHSSSAAQANRLASGIDDLLTTVRQETRQAAFRDAVKAIKRAAQLAVFRASVAAPEGDANKQARELVDCFRFASPPVQSLRFLEWEPLVEAIANALHAASSSTLPAEPVQPEGEQESKL